MQVYSVYSILILGLISMLYAKIVKKAGDGPGDQAYYTIILYTGINTHVGLSATNSLVGGIRHVPVL